MSKTGCDCNYEDNLPEGTYYCERHKINKARKLITLCKTRKGYFEAWESGHGPGQKAKGLGDKVAKTITTLTAGRVTKCGGCKNRQKALNTLGDSVVKALTPKKNKLFPSDSFTNQATILDDTDLVRDSLKLAGLIIKKWPQVDGIAGVPRSGIIAASHIATNLGLPLYSSYQGVLNKIGGGRRMKNALATKQRNIVVVEDSVNSGWNMENAVGSVPDRRIIGKAAVYCTPIGHSKVDLYAVSLPLPHWFTWHMFGSGLLSQCKTGFDFDGILCHDCSPNQDDDGVRYLDFLNNVPPKWLYTGGRISTIITARLEKYRPQTTKWLETYRQRYGSLVMGSWPSLHSRNRSCVGSWKAEMCIENELCLFVESDPYQAEIISKKANIPVMCPPARKIYA